MIRPGIEPRSPGPLANILTIMPMGQSIVLEMHKRKNLKTLGLQRIILFERIFTNAERFGFFFPLSGRVS